MGADVLTVVTLSFLEAALGKRHSLQVSQSRASSPFGRLGQTSLCMRL